ncbi:hypothetical protein [Methylocapsa sp. S129]|uniref:hypothetical protein n=1 Tax=Methylocapsa sp. S129 TaxID=1641869 RepID=UPI00131ECC48|nr:hypothetical protein [Methylocapsa sp. S129]
MLAVMKSPREPPAAKLDEDGGPPPLIGDEVANGPGASGGSLDHFQQIATMIELLDRLPELAGDIRDWRPSHYADQLAEAPRGKNDDILRAYGELSPLMQRAFQAVVAGMDKLAESAADLYDHTHRPPTSSEIKAGAEIGRAMRQLLERAMALVESASPRRPSKGHTSHEK